jgi:hypothetical protein
MKWKSNARGTVVGDIPSMIHSFGMEARMEALLAAAFAFQSDISREAES